MTSSAASLGCLPRLFALWVAIAPLAAHAQPFALEQHFEDGIEPCFDAAQLTAATLERMQRSSAGDATTAVSPEAPRSAGTSEPIVGAAPGPAADLQVQLRIAVDGERWLASFTSENRATGERGVREIAVSASCTGLLDAISLVLALIVEQAGAAAASAAPAAPLPAAEAQSPSPSPPPPPPPYAATKTAHGAARRDSTPRMAAALSASGGVALGVAPKLLPALQLEASLPLTARPAKQTIMPLSLALGLDAFAPRETVRSGVRLSMYGAAVQANVCAGFTYGALSVESCPGLWFRAVHLSVANDSVLEPATFGSAGWSLRLSVPVRIAEHWSLFVRGEALVPFALQIMRLALRPPRTLNGEDTSEPFFNAPVLEQGDPAVPIIGIPAEVGRTRPGIEPYRIAHVGAALLAGVTLAL